ncbi:unnamed protein product, partial [Mesorhabditis spiculigera]
MRLTGKLSEWGTRVVDIGGNQVGLEAERIDSHLLTEKIAAGRDEQANEAPFLLVNLDTLIARYDRWIRELPQVKPFYAVKSNPSPVVLRVLAGMGVNFDCASRGEIEQVLSLGVSPDRIIFANPAKPASYIQYAQDVGVYRMTVDSSEELRKIAVNFPQAEILLRLATSDKSAMTPLSGKFGADGVRQIPDLLREALSLGLNIVGISFHVGSGCRDPTSFGRALEETHRLHELGKTIGHQMTVIDIGGGFPGGQINANFEACANEIRSSLETLFNDDTYEILAEPGRYFCSEAFTLCANVIHSNEIPPEYDPTGASTGTQMKYYLNDGVFGSFACKFFQYLHSEGQPLRPKTGRPILSSTIFGPTCDTWDKIEDNRQVEKMEIGEWIYYRDMGAYSCACASTFNGFQPPEHIFAISEQNWARIKPLLEKDDSIA